ncbi:family 78 glycoside hydrolase catalytic domain [Granulicella mallensis]|uniref:alpha-L-rhamnosidase n=1 Tax=Granulicella mallensis TaxID=940614 RepID=A0A7W8EB81_9BACT|nr:family 78 glycoside hydrolase catalytic domain [Granulicella mallensis]MBB5064250.1 alpha-L-rhamnosidase [Granulicella mallensis]
MLKLVLSLFILVTCVKAEPVHLRTNALENPLGLDTPNPTFSWQSDAKTTNWTQSAYEVLVSTEAKNLRPGKADAWDSGRIKSSESVNIAYAGAGLKPQQRYVWTVRTWDNKGKETTSAPAWFETGLMSAADWKGQWITRKDPADEQELGSIRWIWLANSDPMHVLSATPAHFLYHLHLTDKPNAASLHVLARGQFVARVNGHVTGHHDEWGAFDREEMAFLLHPGDNEIEVDVISHQAGEPPRTAPSAFAASIHLTHEDGKEERIVTNDQWQARATPESAWQSAQTVGALSQSFGLGTDRQRAVPGPDRVATDASLLRKSFSVDSSIRTARLSITALGAYQAFINGKAVAPNSLLAPGWTDFHKRVLYQTYDVTSLLSHGANAIGVVLGGGWYSSPMTWSGFRYTPGPNLLRAQLDLTLANGTHQTIATDPSWLTASASITFSEIYGGESYDARLAQQGWSAPSFDAMRWTAAVAAAPPDSGMVLTAQPDLLVNTTITLHPRKLDPANDAHPTIYDMGQNMVGNIRIHVRGPRGTVVRLRYAERLNPDGSIYTENLRNADATDTYVLSGDGDETWTPAFTFHGFRYVEFSYVGTAPPTPPTLATIDGLVFNSLPAKPSVRLTSSSETLNKMNELGAWGQRGNFVSIPTDCPQRDERLGWMGDAGVFWRTGTYNFDIDAFTHKFMLDVTDAQTAAGAFTDVSPNILGPNPGAPGWGDAGVFIPYAAWLQYGDTTVVERSWPAMERWMDFILSNNPDYIRRKALGNNYADWLAPDQNTPRDLIGTAYWALIAREMAEMATALHRTADAEKYQQQYDRIAAAYRTAFVKEDGSVEGNTQTAYLATIFTGIAPPALRARMIDRLTKDIEAHGNHLTTGFLGTPFLLFVLDENDRSDLAFKLLLSDTYPSWGYMVKKGATTWWERWNGDTGDPGMNSYNHYAFGSVMAWVYRRAAGIDTDATGPGYHHLTIHPHFDPALPQLHTEYDSAYGTIISDWQESGHRFTITIPANTTATVTLPKGKTEEIGSGTHVYHVE